MHIVTRQAGPCSEGKWGVCQGLPIETLIKLGRATISRKASKIFVLHSECLLAMSYKKPPKANNKWSHPGVSRFSVDSHDLIP